jgi:nucleotide sugar dehydrogenase
MYPKLVGGVTPSCTTRGVEFYESVIDSEKRDDLSKPNGVWAMENVEAAEFAKIAETTFRDVNIGLANEFAIYAKKYGIDIHQVIEAANSQPFSHIHTPGIAVGGHCIPVYPKFYTWKNSEAQIVEAARQRNLNMPSRAVNQIIEAIGSIAGMNIGILGITYRPGVKEVALSGAMTLLKLLKDEGATVFGDDPLLNREEIISLGFDGAGVPNEIEGLILQTSHSEYQELDFMGKRNLQFFYDGRNAFSFLSEQMNFTYLSL